MKNAIYYVSYKLKKGKSTADFLAAAESLNKGYISKQPGYVSWQQLNAGETWADMCTFETMTDLENFIKASETPGELALTFYSYINLPSCKSHYYTVERTYKN